MRPAHVTQTGNVSIPKKWGDESGIEPNSNVVIEKTKNKIVIEALNKRELKSVFRRIDDEIKKKKITFTRQESIRDDPYD